MDVAGRVVTRSRHRAVADDDGDEDDVDIEHRILDAKREVNRQCVFIERGQTNTHTCDWGAKWVSICNVTQKDIICLH